MGCGAAAVALPRWAHGAASGARPNIVLILVDDMGWSDIGCYGGEVATPNLDRLASEGIRFTQMHNTSKCFPSRACLLTGVYAQQCGMDREYDRIRNAVTLGEVLRTAGYRTLATGKHHCRESLYDRGFDRYYGLRDGCCNFFNPGERRPGEAEPVRKRVRTWCIDEKTYTPYTPKEKDFYTTDYFTKYALSYLDEYKDEDKPFLLYLAYTAPHDPLMAWPEDIDKYRGKYMAGYQAIRSARYERQCEMGLVDPSMPLSEATSVQWDELPHEKQVDEDLKMAIYAAMIDRVDQNIGKLLDKLKEMGRYDNTLILFASDNGCSSEFAEKSIGGPGERGGMHRWTSLGGDWANVSNTPYRLFKNYSHEGGICTPFIAWWPDVIKNGDAINNDATHFIDVMATLAEVSGARYPAEFNGETVTPMQGVSLMPIFEGKTLPECAQPLYWQWSKGKAIHQGRWKAVAYGGQWELYDLDRDRHETNNLAAVHPEVLARRTKLHSEWAGQFSAD